MIDKDPDGGFFDDPPHDDTHPDPLHTPPYTNGSLSVVVPMDDFEVFLRQMWKSRSTEPKVGELYKKYRELTTFEE